MFTLDQIKEAHSKVKSGADFPKYIQELKILGVATYNTFVSDGHSVYSGAENTEVTSPGKYPEISINKTVNAEEFKANLKAHQQGKTDYPAFISHCAEAGVEKWQMDIEQMTCTYFDLHGNVILAETVPD